MPNALQLKAAENVNSLTSAKTMIPLRVFRQEMAKNWNADSRERALRKERGTLRTQQTRINGWLWRVPNEQARDCTPQGHGHGYVTFVVVRLLRLRRKVTSGLGIQASVSGHPLSIWASAPALSSQLRLLGCFLVAFRTQAHRYSHGPIIVELGTFKEEEELGPHFEACVNLGWFYTTMQEQENLRNGGILLVKSWNRAIGWNPIGWNPAILLGKK